MSESEAQINVNVNINSQPAWGPTGYDNANYYYFPSLNVYFDVSNSLFYYLSGSNWVSDRYLPNKYSNNDLYSTYKVVINNKETPWKSNSQHKKEYSQYKNNNKQESIRNSNDDRYSQSKKNTVPWINSDNDNSANAKKKKNSQNNSQSNNKKSKVSSSTNTNRENNNQQNNKNSRK